jgi:hypothetical protein
VTLVYLILSFQLQVEIAASSH